MKRVFQMGSLVLIPFLLISCGGTKTSTPQLPNDPVEQLSFSPELSEIENRFLGYALKYIYEDYTILFDEHTSKDVKELRTSENRKKLEDFYVNTLQKNYPDTKEKFDVFYTATVTPYKIGLYYAHIAKTDNLNTNQTIPSDMKGYSWVLANYPDVWNYTNSENEEKIKNGEKIPFAYLAPEKKAEIYAFLEWGAMETGRKT